VFYTQIPLLHTLDAMQPCSPFVTTTTGLLYARTLKNGFAIAMSVNMSRSILVNLMENYVLSTLLLVSGA
jgi:hypothetical protein